MEFILGTKVCVVGAGAWGSCIASILASAGNEVLLVSSSGRKIDEQLNFLRFPNRNGSLLFSDEIPWMEEGIYFLAPAFKFLEKTAIKLKEKTQGKCTVVNLSKGISAEFLTSSEVVEKIMPKAEVFALSGGSHAEEVIEHKPCLLGLGYKNKSKSQKIAALFKGTSIFVENCPDRKSIELVGAMKNILSIGAGLSDGLKLGDNFRSALISKGYEEISKISTALGGEAKTLLMPCCLGDLFATTMSEHSRNRKFGLLFAQTNSISETLAIMDSTVEGIAALENSVNLFKKLGMKARVIPTIKKIIINESPLTDLVNVLNQE